jgi:xanthine permease XanP
VWATPGVVASALAVMVGLNIWTTGRLKLFCILIGMVAGYAAAAAFGLLTWNDLSVALDRATFALPTASHISWAFDWELVVPFAVAGLAAAMNTTATITTYQRLSDAEWVKPDMKSISRGVLADGIATVCAGLFGTYGLVVASANVGLVAATGVSSRVIAFACSAPAACDRGAAHPSRGAGHHAASRDGVGVAVHRSVHHDRRHPDHLESRAR